MSGFIQNPLLSNDSTLKNLDQMVEISLSKHIIVSRTLIAPFQKTDTLSLQNSDSLAVKNPVLKGETSHQQSYHSNKQTIDPLKPILETSVSIPSDGFASSGIILPEEEIRINTQSWMIGIFVIVFLLFSIVKVFYRNYVGQLLSSGFNFNEAKKMFKEKSLSFTHAAFRFDIIFYLVTGVFLYQVAEFFSIQFYSVEWMNYFFITGGLIFFITIKKILYFFMGYVTKSFPETSEYIFNINNYNRILGIFLFPMCLIIEFIPRLQQEYLFIIGIIFSLFLYFLLLFRGIKILLRKHFSIFYLILYLCYLEILPILYLYQLAMKFFLI